MIPLIYLVLGGVLGFLIGLNSKDFPTDTINLRILENDKKDLESKVERYRGIIRDLIRDNKRLLNESNKD